MKFNFDQKLNESGSNQTQKASVQDIESKSTVDNVVDWDEAMPIETMEEFYQLMKKNISECGIEILEHNGVFTDFDKDEYIDKVVCLMDYQSDYQKFDIQVYGVFQRTINEDDIFYNEIGYPDERIEEEFNNDISLVYQNLPEKLKTVRGYIRFVVSDYNVFFGDPNKIQFRIYGEKNDSENSLYDLFGCGMSISCDQNFQVKDFGEPFKPSMSFVRNFSHACSNFKKLFPMLKKYLQFENYRDFPIYNTTQMKEFLESMVQLLHNRK